MPAAFISHGSPMVAIETGPYQEALQRFGREHRPKAIVVISAHWESGDEVRIASAAKHRLVYDFGGFPDELYTLTYEAAETPGWRSASAACCGTGAFGPRWTQSGAWTTASGFPFG